KRTTQRFSTFELRISFVLRPSSFVIQFSVCVSQRHWLSATCLRGQLRPWRLAQLTNQHSNLVRRSYSDAQAQIVDPTADRHRPRLVRRAKSLPLGAGRSAANHRRPPGRRNAHSLSPTEAGGKIP